MRSFGGSGGPDITSINSVNDINLISVNRAEEAHLPDSFWRAHSTLWCQASQDKFKDKQLSIFESIGIQQFWPFRFSNSSSEEESRIRPLFKVKIFVALNIWQDLISEISIEEIAILRIVVLIKFSSLLKTHFSFAVAAVWIPEIRMSSSSSSVSGASPLPSVPWHPVPRMNLNALPINAFFASLSCLEVGELAALSIGGWRIVAKTLKTFCKEISFRFIKQLNRKAQGSRRTVLLSFHLCAHNSPFPCMRYNLSYCT